MTAMVVLGIPAFGGKQCWDARSRPATKQNKQDCSRAPSVADTSAAGPLFLAAGRQPSPSRHARSSPSCRPRMHCACKHPSYFLLLRQPSGSTHTAVSFIHASLHCTISRRHRDVISSETGRHSGSIDRAWIIMRQHISRIVSRVSWRV